MKRRSSVPLVPAFLLAACTTAPPPPVAVVTADQVAGCTYVKDITATPGVFGPLAAQGLQDARRTALDSAARDGANAIVFDEPPAGQQVFEIRAVAYRC